MKLNNVFFLLGLSLFFTNCATKLASLTKSEKTDGFVSLFDGQSLDGWHVFKNGTNYWSVEDGAIALNPGKQGGDLVTDKAYENYELRLEWKISDCGNSGIIYNVKEEGYTAVWKTGPEMQVLDNKCHPDAKIKTHRAGDLYDMIACNEETVKPANEWNAVRLIINNGKVEHWLNGKKVVEFEMFNDNWTAMVGKSKFKNMADFGTIRKGKIALQDHHDKVWYRNIRIKEL
ncbi:MAG: DUF1080 domain-containing protein [Saprospiraceae bacterium]